MTLNLPWPLIGGAEKPGSLEEFAEKVQANLEFIARQFPVGSENVAGLYSGTGTPEGAVSAPVGSVYRRGDGGTSTTLYVKESGTGNTGWVAK